MTIIHEPVTSGRGVVGRKDHVQPRLDTRSFSEIFCSFALHIGEKSCFGIRNHANCGTTAPEKAACARSTTALVLSR